MDTVELNPNFQSREGLCLGDQADKIRQLFPVLQEKLVEGFDARENRTIKVNAALLFDGDGIWYARIAFYSWSASAILEAFKMLNQRAGDQMYEVLIWALDEGPVILDLRPFDVTILYQPGRPKLTEKMGQVQQECLDALIDETNRFVEDDHLGPLRLSLVIVRDFNACMGTNWREVFPSVQEWAETGKVIIDMALCHADGIAFRSEDHVDLTLARLATVEDLSKRKTDVISAQDETWLLSKSNCHLMCADLVTMESVRKQLEGKRRTYLFDVTVIQTSYVNPTLEHASILWPGQLHQGKSITWLDENKKTGSTVTNYVYHERGEEKPFLFDQRVPDTSFIL